MVVFPPDTVSFLLGASFPSGLTFPLASSRPAAFYLPPCAGNSSSPEWRHLVLCADPHFVGAGREHTAVDNTAGRDKVDMVDTADSNNYCSAFDDCKAASFPFNPGPCSHAAGKDSAEGNTAHAAILQVVSSVHSSAFGDNAAAVMDSCSLFLFYCCCSYINISII